MPQLLAPTRGLLLGGLQEREVTPAEQEDSYWRQSLFRMLGAVDITASGEQYAATIRTFELSHLKLATMEGSAIRVRRAQRHITGDDAALVVMLLVSGVAAVEQGNRQVSMKSGETVLFDMARPMSLEFLGSFCVKLFVVPRRILGLREESLRRVTAAPICPDMPMGSLVAAFLTRLVDAAADCPSLAEVPLASSALDLLNLLAEEQLESTSPGSAGGDRVLEIKRFIERNIGDSDLTPEAVARAHHISVRYLHKIFQSTGTTVRQWIQQCRLQKCRSELARLDAKERSIAGVAHRWGFASASHFSRAFRSQYGITPAEWRDPSMKASPRAY